MSRPVESRCLGCGCTDAKACAGGCEWSLVDRFARIGVCTRCADGKHGARLRETFTTEVQKSRSTCATREVA
jgi:hypothetical protein